MSYPAPGYPASPPPSQPQSTSNWAGIVALIAGIAAIVLSFIPFVNILAILLGLAAVVFGIVGLVMKGRSKGLSIAGLIMGALAIVIASIVLVVTGIFVAGASKAIDDANSSGSANHQVEYIVTVNKGSAEVAYGSGASTSSATVKGTWTKSGSLTGYDSATVTVSGDFDVSGQKVSCEIKLDGKSVDKQSGTDMVSCSASTD